MKEELLTNEVGKEFSRNPKNGGQLISITYSCWGFGWPRMGNNQKQEKKLWQA